jgi:hypothetical protein
LEQNEGFPQVVVALMIYFELPQHHHAAKHQYRQKRPDEMILAQKPHNSLYPRVRTVATE